MRQEKEKEQKERYKPLINNGSRKLQKRTEIIKIIKNMKMYMKDYTKKILIIHSNQKLMQIVTY